MRINFLMKNQNRNYKSDSCKQNLLYVHSKIIIGIKNPIFQKIKQMYYNLIYNTQGISEILYSLFLTHT